jgi:hypothetical protein
VSPGSAPTSRSRTTRASRDRGAVLFKRTDDRVSLLQGTAADEDAARELLQALPPEATTLHWLNGPQGDPFNAAISSLGGTCTWRQHEMVLELAG